MQAENSITLGGAGAYTVTSSANVLYEAGSTIQLLPGTHIKEVATAVFKITPNLVVVNGNSSPDASKLGLRLKEHHIYGSSRLGVRNVEKEEGIEVSSKSYELSNHLGNVLAVVSDQRIAEKDDDGNDAKDSEGNIIFTKLPNVLSFSDYFPFGMTMPGRNDSGDDDYRYGFGGHEKDDEVKGKGNHYDFGNYGLDVRIGRRFQMDPVTFVSQSPYATFDNNPIYYSDPSGRNTETEIETDPKPFKLEKSDVLLDEVVVKAKKPNVFQRMLRAVSNFFSQDFFKDKDGLFHSSWAKNYVKPYQLSLI